MLTKFQQFILASSFILSFILTACGAEPTPVMPEGDPTEAAREFMSALYEGDTDKCRNLSSQEVRDSVAQLCRSIDERSAVASIDLTETTFEVISSESATVTITMSGRWTILNIDSDGQSKEETHDSATEGPIVLFMIYEDDNWRFHGFDE